MPRLSMLSVLLIGLPLIGCGAYPDPAGQSKAVPVPGSPGTTTGSFVAGVQPDRLVITDTPSEISLTQQNTASDILAHTATGPFVQLHH
jgi:hypothetical protein